MQTNMLNQTNRSNFMSFQQHTTHYDLDSVSPYTKETMMDSVVTPTSSFISHKKSEGVKKIATI